MARFTALFIFAAALTACTISLAPEDILVGDEDFRREGFSALDIQKGDLLPEEVGLRHEWLESDIGPLALTWAQQSAEHKADRLVVYCMGNMTDRQSDGADYLAGVLPFGDAVIFDYPGYGDSAGPTSLENIETTLLAVANRARREGYQDIVVWGHSMGGFLCPRMVEALGSNVSGVVLEATFNDASVLSRYALAWYLKPFVRLRIDERFLAYNTAETLRGFDGSVIVLAAGQDEDLPLAALRDLADQLDAASLNVTYLAFEGAGHYDIAEQPNYISGVRSVLDGR
ncbi:MAG: alpha/beta fold hydrolase [Pseudomonadota bacterium]